LISSPYRRAEGTTYEDHHLALIDSFYDRFPSFRIGYNALETIDPMKVIMAHYEVGLPLIQRLFASRGELMKCKANMMTPLSQLHGPDALLRYNATGTKSLKVCSKLGHA
jgi:hypothetical protein